MLVYDVTDSKSFENIAEWMKSIEKNASPNVCKLVVGNKCDMNETRVSPKRPSNISGESR